MPFNTLPAEPRPELPINTTPRFAVRETQFGEGYSQKTLDGINHRTDEVALQWLNITTAEFTTLETFISAHAPHIPFLYTAPGAQGTRLYTCEEFDHEQVSAAHYNFTATIKEYHGA